MKKYHVQNYIKYKRDMEESIKRLPGETPSEYLKEPFVDLDIGRVSVLPRKDFVGNLNVVKSK